MTALVRSTNSPSSSSMSRSTPWVEGCWGPMLMIIVSSSGRSTSIDAGVEHDALGEPQHRAGLASQLHARRVAPAVQLLAALARLGESAPRCVRSGRPPTPRGRPVVIAAPVLL